mmetsp:Transcript_164793/g.528702  ORF Transcript_164793/g.528702 Transcript_164793/m.528702 type:complete len:218 (+) Transcript_164793:570-1223(+)
MAPAIAMPIGKSIPMSSLECITPVVSPCRNANMYVGLSPCAENSIINHMLVTGLRNMIARNAVAATTDIGASSFWPTGAKFGQAYCQLSPMIAPSVAPSATDGVNVPPAAPEPIAPAVIMALKKSKSTKYDRFLCRLMATSANARPLPSRLGKVCESRPSTKKAAGMITRIFQSRAPSGWESSNSCSSRSFSTVSPLMSTPTLSSVFLRIFVERRTS